MHYKNPRSLFKIKLRELFFNPWMHTSLNCDSTSHVLENNNIALHTLNTHFPHLHFHSVYHNGFQCCQKYPGPVRCYKINLKPRFKPSVLHTCCRVKTALCSTHLHGQMCQDSWKKRFHPTVHMPAQATDSLV